MITQFGSYLLDEPLAQGGMARIYRARLRGLGGFEKPLVVKQVLPELARDPRFVEMFVREAKTLVAMSHPHIVSVYELGVVEGVYFLAMEYVEGATIAEIVQGAGALAPAPGAQLMLQVCDALEYAHDRFGILHRDLSPRNIIVDRSGHARLLDFGISTHVDSDERGGFGSIGYMAPEQLLGEPVSVRSDLFGLGAVLFEVLSGTPAFLREDRPATKRAVLEEPLPRLAAERYPARLRELVSRLLAREPSERPESARAVGRELRGYLSQAAPEGALEPLAARVEQARAQRPREPREIDQTPPLAVRAVAAPRTLATSPVLEEVRRKSGPKPVPTPASTPAAGAQPVPTGESTRPITGRRSVPQAPGDERAAEGAAVSAWRGERAGGQRRRRRRGLWGALALAGVGLIAGTWWTGRDGGGSSETEPSRAGEPTAAGAGGAGAREQATEGGGVEGPSGSTSPTPAAVPPAAPESSSTATTTATTTTTATATATSTATSTATTAGADSAAGALEVNALPWAELKLDGRPVGTTPLRRRAISAGKHTLVAHCPPLGREAQVPIVIHEGRPTRVLIDLQAQPAEITIR